jgi:uncharacterized protein YbbC (DUF1343 family)
VINSAHKIFFTLLILFAFTYCNNAIQDSSRTKVVVGADVLLSDSLNLIQNKRVGIVTNHTGVFSSGTHLVDTLFKRNDVYVTALFGPEHGIRGEAADGIIIKDSKDPATGIPVFSIYGKTKRPTPEMLKNVDLLIYDMQTIGVRYYTFISTLFNVLEAAAENNIPLIVLDRPNPLGGVKVEGPVLHEKFISFVGIAPIPIRHGMTIGELAFLFNESGMIKAPQKADLKIIKMKNWKREFYYDDCNIEWINPSPNIPDLNTAIVYPGVALIKGTNVSKGRGTYTPFLKFGAPFINANELIRELAALNINGLEFNETEFFPIDIPGKAFNPKFENQLCYGIELKVIDRDLVNSVETGIKIIYALHKLYPKQFKFRTDWIHIMFGNSYLMEMIENNRQPEEIIFRWQNELESFLELRKQYLLY